MGMFDFFRSSYDLGEEFTNVECQTKQMDTTDWLGGSLSQFWLDPHGYLYKVNTSGTHDFHAIDEDDPHYDAVRKWSNFDWLPNGKHGKVEPHYITKYVDIYPSIFNGPWETWPVCRLHFKAGRLVDFEDVTGR